MHTIWKGAISFGLVHIPVKMFSATEDKDITMKYLHKVCGTPVSNIRSCSTCENQVEWNDVVRGYEYEKNRFVTFEKDELSAIQGQDDKTIKIIDFIAQNDVDLVFYQKSYYLGTDDFGTEAYQLLCEALMATQKIAIASVTLRSKSHLAVLRVKNNYLVLETIHYPDEVRSIELVPNEAITMSANKKELNLAIQLIKRLSTTFSPEKYKDEYRLRLSENIQKKIAGEQITVTPAENKSNVMDLMEALQASMKIYDTNKKQTNKSKRKPKSDQKSRTSKNVSTDKGKNTDKSAESGKGNVKESAS